MKKMWLSPYKLFHIKAGTIKQGFLLKMRTSEFEEGYADIFPWSEFGDPDPKEIPQLLRQDSKTYPLLQRSLYFAEKDGRARVEKKSLGREQKIKNHYLVENIDDQTREEIQKALQKGFDRFKLKVGRDWIQERLLLQNMSPILGSAKWRLDCNLRGHEIDWNFLETFREQIEFIEDPFPEPRKWSKNWPWAYDQPQFGIDQVNVRWQILKPAKQSFNKLDKNQNTVVTSYMDHPIGIAHSLAESQENISQSHDFGFMSFSLYKETPFHKHFKSDGPWLWTEPESGIGFTDLLRQQHWMAL